MLGTLYYSSLVALVEVLIVILIFQVCTITFTIFERRVSSVVETLLSVRKVRGSNLNPVKSDSVADGSLSQRRFFGALLPTR